MPGPTPQFPWHQITLNPFDLFFSARQHFADDRVFFTAMMTAAGVISFYAANWFFGLLTAVLGSKIELIRFQPNKHAEASLVRKAKWVAFFYQILSSAMWYYAYPLLSQWNPDILSADAWPEDALTWVKSFAILALGTETLFYWGHRLLHVGPFYRGIHKIHHEFRVTVGYACVYAHPIEFLFANVVPVHFTGLLLKYHTSVLIAWLFISVVYTVKDHSGVMLPWDLSHTGFHDWHHEGNVGNYGVIGLWDTLLGTTRGWKKQQEKLSNQFYTTAPAAQGKKQN